MFSKKLINLFSVGKPLRLLIVQTITLQWKGRIHCHFTKCQIPPVNTNVTKCAIRMIFSIILFWENTVFNPSRTGRSRAHILYISYLPVILLNHVIFIHLEVGNAAAIPTSRWMKMNRKSWVPEKVYSDTIKAKIIIFILAPWYVHINYVNIYP